jgi:hypothetical protein
LQNPITLGSKQNSGPRAEEVVGKWSASTKDATFEMKLAEDGNFTWVSNRDGNRREVRGVYALDGGILAMETDFGDMLLAEISSGEQKNAMRFQMLGGPTEEPGLKFTR